VEFKSARQAYVLLLIKALTWFSSLALKNNKSSFDTLALVSASLKVNKEASGLDRYKPQTASQFKLFLKLISLDNDMKRTFYS